MEIKILPHAGIVKEGDCGACCIGTVAKISVKEVYQIYGSESPLAYHAIITILQKLGMEYENWLPACRVTDNREDWFTFGYPAYENWMEWFKVSMGRTKRNMIGIAHVNLHGKANIDPYADHWVLITVEDKGSDGKDKMVNIHCSTKGNYSVDANDF